MRWLVPVLLLVLALPAFAVVDDEVTIPVVGYLQLGPDLLYRTEYTITNHRDVEQYVETHFIQDGRDEIATSFSLKPRETRFIPGFPQGQNRANFIAALRIVAPSGRIEAKAFIVAEHPITRGDTRQEVESIAKSEYLQEEMVFLGVRHSAGTGKYTNVGIVNLHPTDAQTFTIEYERSGTLIVTVPPLSSRQVRVTGPGVSYRALRVLPDWSQNNGAPKPWVAYASTVDTHTGDAFSGIRVPAGSYYDFIE